MPDAWRNLEEFPAYLRGTPLVPYFAVGGKGYELLKGNDVRLTYRTTTRDGTIIPQSAHFGPDGITPLWKYHELALLPGSEYAYPPVALSKVIVSFHADLLSSPPVASAEIPLINSGLFDAGESTESFQGVCPASELAKLANDTWYLASLKGFEDDDRWSICPFYVRGGI